MRTIERIKAIWQFSIMTKENSRYSQKCWCEDNFGPDGECSGTVNPRCRWTYFYADGEQTPTFYFKDEDDLILFKLSTM